MNPRKILIVRTDRIGDVLLTTPAIRVLKNRLPDAHITVLVAKNTRPLLKDNPNIDNIIVDDKTEKNRGLFGFLRLVKSLRRMKFDTAIIYHTKKRTNLACCLACIPRRIGYKNEKFGFLLTDPVVDVRSEGKKHEAQYCLDVLKSLDIYSNDISLDVSVSDKEKVWVDQVMSDNQISTELKMFGIHLGASDPSKVWPKDNFLKLIDKLNEKDVVFVFIGNESTCDMADYIIKRTDARIIDLTGKTNLEQLISIINRLDIFISNDSGPVHIAAALKKPVVSIFTRNQPGINPIRWKPLGEKSAFVAPRENLDISFQKAGQIDPKNIENVSVSEVLEAVDSIIKL